jgi:hypothetical protein
MQSDTVGTDQRGDIQEDSRPDFIWFDDFETRKTLRSAVVTHAIWDNMEEARNGLAKTGAALYNCNYVSERGNVHKLVQTKSDDRVTLITSIKIGNKPAWPDAYTIAEINNIEKNAEDFAGEYLCEPSVGADVFFDRQTVEGLKTREPIRNIGGLKLFYNHDPSHRYGLGADVAAGVGLDSSTSVIINFSTTPSRVVATYKDNLIKPDTFGDELKSQGDRFGACVVAPENNSFGYATVARLRQIYDNIFFTEIDQTKAGLPPRARNYGWNTNSDTKPKMLFALKKAVESGHLEISDEDLKAELRSYSRDDLLDKDEDARLTTRHFDLLIACAIAYQIKDFAQVKKESITSYNQTEYERSGLE